MYEWEGIAEGYSFELESGVPPPPREPEVFDGGRKAFVYHSARRSRLCDFLCQNRRKDPPS